MGDVTRILYFARLHSSIDAPASIDEADGDPSSGGVHYHCAIVSSSRIRRRR